MPGGWWIGLPGDLSRSPTSRSQAGEFLNTIRFETGQVKVVDLASHLDGPIFEPLKDLNYFRRFAVNTNIDTVAWLNNADFSPEFLYEIGMEVGEQETARDGVSTGRER